MKFNNHSGLEGSHAFLSPSSYHWIRYDDDRMMERFYNYQASMRGTELHDFAKQAIRLRQKLPRSARTLNMYVNDAIGYGMVPEQTLFYSYNCYGTADTIGFMKRMLRIFDLKTGKRKASIEQLMVYAALFCLEYNHRPGELEYDLRIYQNDDVVVYEPAPDEIAHIMDRIVYFDNMINKLKLEGGLG